MQEGTTNVHQLVSRCCSIFQYLKGMSGTWRTNSLTGVDGPVGHSRLFNLITLEPALVTADRETLEASRGRAGQILAAVILASVLLTDGGNPACREERERERERERREIDVSTKKKMMLYRLTAHGGTRHTYRHRSAWGTWQSRCRMSS